MHWYYVSLLFSPFLKTCYKFAVDNDVIYLFRRDILELHKGSKQDVKNAITTAFIGQSVITTYNNKVYKIDDVDFEVNPLSGFDKNGEQVELNFYFYFEFSISN